MPETDDPTTATPAGRDDPAAEPANPPAVAEVNETPPEVTTGIAMTATATQVEEGGSIVRLLAVSGVILLVAGWLLPWFVEPTASGIGYSPMDAAFSFTGPGTVAVWVIGVAVLILLLGVVTDAAVAVVRRLSVAHDLPSEVLTPYQRAMQRFRDYRRAALRTVLIPLTWLSPVRGYRVRAIASVAGVVATVALVILIGALHEEPLFGDLSSAAVIDNAVWMTLTGFLLCSFGFIFHRWIIRHGSIAFAGVAFAVGGFFPLIFGQAGDFVGWGARSAAIYILLALGLNVVVGFAGLLDLGYAAFFAIGAYTTASFGGYQHGIHLPFWVLIFLGAAVASLFGAILGAPTLRLRGDYLAIVTLGFGEIVPDMATNNIFNLTGGPNGLGADPAALFGHSFGSLGALPENTKYYFWLLLVLIAVVLVALRNLERSRLGRAWVAIREDEIAAAATGINTVTTKLLAFAIGASVSGFAGAFFGAALGTVTPDNFSFAVSVTALSTVVLGGIGSIPGVVVGAVSIAFLVNWIIPNLTDWSSTFGSTTGVTFFSTIDYTRYTYMVYGLILLLIMLLRPAGLLPSRARKVELATGTESAPLSSVQRAQ